jgi:peptidoglycan/LPS O-acetylase OafA/YrhL
MADHPPAHEPAPGSAAGLQSAPEALRPPPGHPRFPLFDSLRAFAALGIVFVHVAIFSFSSDAWFWPVVAHFDMGVPFFFLLSGFLLYRPFVATRILGARATRVRDYGRRRFLRIAPAYWVALTVLTIFPGLYGAFSGNWWVYYGLLQNYPVYTAEGGCAVDVFNCGIAPAWSLAIEVGFYIALPFFALAMGALIKRLPRRGWVTAELAVLGLLSGISVAIQATSGSSELYTWLFFSPLGRAWWFALGMALAVMSVRVQERGSEPPAVRWIAANPTAPWAAAAVIYVAASLLWLDPGPIVAGPGESRFEYVAGYILFGVIAALVMLPAVFGHLKEEGLPRRVMRNRVLSWLGLISYGIFLWHYPIAVALAEGGVNDWVPDAAFLVLSALTLAITIPCAALSYYLVERPLMRFK